MLAAAVDLHLNNSVHAGSDRLNGLLVLAAFLLSFGFIRMSTRLMRSPKVPWWPGSVTTGDLHLHHLVFGIVLLMLAGFLEFALDPGSPWVEALAIAFGIGIGLTLDEFALWLHLEDVYWAEEGRSSIDAVVVATIIACAVVLGLAPLDTGSGNSAAALIFFMMYDLAICTVVVLKGKITTALVGLFVLPIAWIGAIRVARASSYWARKRYSPDGDKMREAIAREERSRKRYRRMQNLIGGAPSGPDPPA